MHPAHTSTHCLTVSLDILFCQQRSSFNQISDVFRVKPRAVPPEKALDPVELAAHVKKVFGATPSNAPPLPSATAPPTWRSSLSDHRAGLPALQKQALKMKNGKATTTWSIPAELHKFHLARADQLTFDQPIPQYMLWYCVLMCCMQHGDDAPYRLADGEVFIIPNPGGSGPDYMRFINLLDSTGKLFFGNWLLFVLDPYRRWQFRFTTTRRSSDCLAIRYAVCARACRVGWCVSEQFWDVVKAFDMLSRSQLFQDIQATAVWVLVALRSLYKRARMFAGRLWFLTCTGVRQGDKLGPGLFRRTYDAGVAEWYEELKSASVGGKLDVYLLARLTSHLCSAFCVGYRRICRRFCLDLHCEFLQRAQ